jgi:integrase
MATLVEIDGSWRLQFRNPVTGKRATLYTGLTSKQKKKAADLKSRIERLLDSLAHEGHADRESQAWLATIGPELRGKLEKLHLTDDDPNAPKTLEALLTVYFEKKKGVVQEQTRRNWGTVRRKLFEHFSPGKRLDTFTAADGEDFRDALLSTVRVNKGDQKERRYAESHIRKTCQVSNQIFEYAVKKGWVEFSPFAEVPKSAPRNVDPLYITREMTQAVMDAAPHDEFRLLIGLARFAAMRNPSETYPLRWRDIDFKAKRIRITSPKGARHGKGERECPLFPELIPLLEKVRPGTAPGDYVIQHYRRSNNRTLLATVVERAKLEPWPRPFVALRAACITDLSARFPLHTACQWCGNTPPVAYKHYLKTREEDFWRAATETHDNVNGNVQPSPNEPDRKRGQDKG